MITVKVHTILRLREILEGSTFWFSLPGKSTVQDLLSVMTEKWGEKFSSYVLDEAGIVLKPYIRMMVNGRDIPFLQGMETVLHDKDEIHILPPAAGG